MAEADYAEWEQLARAVVEARCTDENCAAALHRAGCEADNAYARYIVAANPTAILVLLSDLAACRAEIAALGRVTADLDNGKRILHGLFAAVAERATAAEQEAAGLARVREAFPDLVAAAAPLVVQHPNIREAARLAAVLDRIERILAAGAGDCRCECHEFRDVHGPCCAVRDAAPSAGHGRDRHDPSGATFFTAECARCGDIRACHLRGQCEGADCECQAFVEPARDAAPTDPLRAHLAGCRTCLGRGLCRDARGMAGIEDAAPSGGEESE